MGGPDDLGNLVTPHHREGQFRRGCRDEPAERHRIYFQTGSPFSSVYADCNSWPPGASRRAWPSALCTLPVGKTVGAQSNLPDDDSNAYHPRKGRSTNELLGHISPRCSIFLCCLWGPVFSNCAFASCRTYETSAMACIQAIMAAHCYTGVLSLEITVTRI